MYIIGIDNGVSGSIGIINTLNNKAICYPTPIKRSLNYTKNVRWLNRIDTKKLKELFTPEILADCKVFLERPMVNPKRFQATVSALRALEATLIVVEELGRPYEYVDSKEWQKMLLPRNIKGSSDLKEAGIQVAKKLFPNVVLPKDGDGLLIAEYGRRKELGKGI